MDNEAKGFAYGGPIFDSPGLSPEPKDCGTSAPGICDPSLRVTDNGRTVFSEEATGEPDGIGLLRKLTECGISGLECSWFAKTKGIVRSTTAGDYRPLSTEISDSLLFWAAGAVFEALLPSTTVFGRWSVGAAEAPIVFTRAMKSTAEQIAKGGRIDKIEVLLQKFGGTRNGWIKFKSFDAAGREVHWYEHNGIGKVGVKWAGFPDPF